MWEIIIGTVVGTGIGLSFHIWHAWYKQFKKKKQYKRSLEKELFRKEIENIVLNYIKQLQTDGKDGNTVRTEKKTKT